MLEAIPTTVTTHPNRPALRVIGGTALANMEAERAAQLAEDAERKAREDAANDQTMSDLAGYVTVAL